MNQFKIALKGLAIISTTGIFFHLSATAKPINSIKTVRAANTISFSSQNQSSNRISLTNKWQFIPESSRILQQNTSTINHKYWQDITVPSNWFLQGQDLAGVVWYQHKFSTRPNLRGKVIKLVFEGVDYAADVWLNGHYLGKHEGYFQPFYFLVSDKLKFGTENVLVVKVNSPNEEPGKVWSLHKRLIKGIFNHHDTRPGGAWSLRGQEKNTGGIWAPVYLQVSEQIAIDRLQVTPDVNPNHQEADAEVALTLNYPGTVSKNLQFRLQLQPENFSGNSGNPILVSRKIKPGINSLKFKLHSSNPRLWWTWEHGSPNLYKLKVSVLAGGRILEQAETVFGFRTITFDPDTKVWKLNGKRLFLRGTNYISSQWLSEMTPQKYGLDIALMKRANINAIRVHAHIEAQKFYQLCDRAGILIWQDFPLQWGYTDAPEFVNEAVKQAKDMVSLLYNHPSIIAWSLHNEPPWDAVWMKHKYPDYNPQQNRQLDAALFNSLVNVDPTRYLHPYSSVDEHAWWGWYSGSWKDFAQPTQQPLITEFGAQALPNLRSLLRIFTPTELLPDTKADWEKWSYHNFQRRETFEIAQVPMGKSPQEFINNTQRYQSQLIQFAAESYRRQRFNPVAAIFQFMFVENWASVNWGVVDYWRNPKPGYTALQVAYQPILPSIVWNQQIWQQGELIHLDLWIINDLWTRFPQARLTYSLQHQGQTLASRVVLVNIEPDSGKQVFRFRSQSLNPGTYELVVKLVDKNGKLLGKNEFQFTVTAVRNITLQKLLKPSLVKQP